MKKLSICAGLIGLALAMLAADSYAAAAGGKKIVHSDTLTGYQEAAPTPVSTTGTGSFRAEINENARTIAYELRYSNLTESASQAHIHFGQRAINGGISVFLCTNLGNGPAGTPACPAGTASEAVVTGTIHQSDIVGPAAQGIAPGEFDELVRAIRAGVTYANVHSLPNFPAGEIRGQVNNEDQRQPE